MNISHGLKRERLRRWLIKRRLSLALVFVFLAVFSGYMLWGEKINGPRTVMTGPGYGLEINGGRTLTALHVAAEMDYPIVYADAEKDIAIIETGHANKYSLKFISSDDDFIFTGEIPSPGESGMPYITGGKIRGVIIGESEGRGVAAAFDETIIHILNQGM